MKTTLEAVSSIKKKLKIEVDRDAVAHAREHALKKLQKEVKLPGFREGKVPTQMIEKQFANELNRQTIDEVIHHSLPEAFQEAKVFPVSRPEVDGGLLSATGGYSYTATFEVLPQIDLKEKDYQGLKLEKNEITVESKEVEGELTRLQEAMTYLEPLPDGTVLEDGLVAMIDYKGSADGKTFAGNEAKDFACELGAKKLLKEFEESLRGMKAGEEKQFPLTYPKDYFNKELAGKSGDFHVKVKSVRKKIVPKLDENFAKDLGKFKDMAEVKADLEKRIGEAKENQEKSNLFQQIVKTLVDQTKFEIPESLLQEELAILYRDYEAHEKQHGKTIAQEELPKILGELKPNAEVRVRSFLVLNRLTELLGVTVPEAEIEKYLDSVAKSVKRPLPEVKAYYEKNRMMNGVKIRLAHEKTLEIVLKEAKIKVVKAKKSKS